MREGPVSRQNRLPKNLTGMILIIQSFVPAPGVTYLQEKMTTVIMSSVRILLVGNLGTMSEEKSRGMHSGVTAAIPPMRMEDPSYLPGNIGFREMMIIFQIKIWKLADQV